MSKPQTGPSVPHTTPRKQALAIGTDPAGFAGGVDMEGDAARAGHPSLPGFPSISGYKEQAPGVSGPGTVAHDTPFKLGGK